VRSVLKHKHESTAAKPITTSTTFYDFRKTHSVVKKPLEVPLVSRPNGSKPELERSTPFKIEDPSFLYKTSYQKDFKSRPGHRGTSFRGISNKVKHDYTQMVKFLA